MDSDSGEKETSPLLNNNSAETKTDDPSPNQNGVLLPPVSTTPTLNDLPSVAALSNGNGMPVVDIADNKIRYTIDLCSGTDDSESDSDSSDSSSSSPRTSKKLPSSSSSSSLSSSSEESSMSEDEICLPEKPKENGTATVDK